MNRAKASIMVAAMSLFWGLMGSATSHAVTCSIVRVDAVSFGAYEPLYGGNVDATGTVVFRCLDVVGGDTVVIEIDRGGASSFARRMLGGAWNLAYNLFLDAAHTVVWGDGTSGTGRYGPTTPPEDADVSVTIYGRIPSGQNVGATTYSDDLVVTITY